MEEFCIVFAAMGVNMETAHFFKQVSSCSGLCLAACLHINLACLPEKLSALSGAWHVACSM